MIPRCIDKNNQQKITTGLKDYQMSQKSQVALSKRGDIFLRRNEKFSCQPTNSKLINEARWQQTLVAAIGVTFSITMFITLLGFMNGLNEMLDGLIINRTAHEVVQRPASQQRSASAP